GGAGVRFAQARLFGVGYLRPTCPDRSPLASLGGKWRSPEKGPAQETAHPPRRRTGFGRRLPARRRAGWVFAEARRQHPHSLLVKALRRRDASARRQSARRRR